MERGKVLRIGGRVLLGGAAGVAALGGAGCDLPGDGAAVNTPTPKVIQCETNVNDAVAQAAQSQDVSESSRWMARIMASGGIQTMQPDRRGASYVTTMVTDTPKPPTVQPTPHPTCVGEGTPVVNPDYVSQLTQNDNVKLLLSSTDSSARQTLIRNYVSTDVPSIGTLIGNGGTIGLPTNKVHFGLNEGFSMDRTGTGFVLIAVDGGLITKQDGTTAEMLLLPVNQKDPVHSQWYALFVNADSGFKILGNEMSLSSSGSHTSIGGKGAKPDQFMTDEQGKLVALGFVTNGYKGDKYVGAFPITIATANAKLAAWIMNPRGTAPESVVAASNLTNDSVSNVAAAVYDQLTGFN